VGGRQVSYHKLSSQSQMVIDFGGKPALSSHPTSPQTQYRFCLLVQHYTYMFLEFSGFISISIFVPFLEKRLHIESVTSQDYTPPRFLA
jgi:hypothetical protein